MNIDKIIVHCSYTPPSMDIGAETIREWHTSPSPHDPSKPWRDIGYQWVIRRDGRLEKGRAMFSWGAHTQGENQPQNVGICLIGGKKEGANEDETNFTDEQYRTLFMLIQTLRATYPGRRELYGHKDFAPKSCPTFDVRPWFEEYEFA